MKIINTHIPNVIDTDIYKKRDVGISKMRSEIKMMDKNMKSLEEKTLSCNTTGIIQDFIFLHDNINESGPKIEKMRSDLPNNEDILDIHNKFSSIKSKYFDLIFDFENNCKHI